MTAFQHTPPVWKFIAPTHPASTSSANIFSTMRQQIDASSEYWEVVETANTGTMSLLLRCVNPPNVLFYSSSANQTILTGSELYIVIANNVTGSTAYRPPHTNAVASGSLQVGLAIGSGTFLGAQRDFPFSQPSGGVWSRYLHITRISHLSQSFFLEAPDILMLGFRETVSHYGAVVGALIEGPTNDDTKLYGVMTSGGDGSSIASNFWIETNGWASTRAVANRELFGVFSVFDNAITRIQTSLGDVAYWDNVAHIANSVSDGNFVTGSTRIFNPINYQFASASAEHIGHLRGMYMSNDAMSLASVVSGASTIGYAFGTSRTSAFDALWFLPMSGSNVNYGPPYAAG